LNLQPPGVVASESITRIRGGVNDGRVKFAFDPATPPAVEPAPSSSGVGLEAPINMAYSFDGAHGTGAATTVTPGGAFVHPRHTSDITSTGINVEGRGVQLFDILGGADGELVGGIKKPLNAQRIADELITHSHATGSVPVDVRPVALAITKGCIQISNGAIT